MARAKRRPGRPPAGDDRKPLNQKVTARFSNEEFEALEKLGQRRRERLASLVRELVLDTLDEVESKLERKK